MKPEVFLHVSLGSRNMSHPGGSGGPGRGGGTGGGGPGRGRSYAAAAAVARGVGAAPQVDGARGLQSRRRQLSGRREGITQVNTFCINLKNVRINRDFPWLDKIHRFISETLSADPSKIQSWCNQSKGQTKIPYLFHSRKRCFRV